MSRSAQRGVTLIEASVVVALVSLTASASLSVFNQFLQRRLTEGVAAELATDLRSARMEAVARNQNVRVAFSSNEIGGRCYVIHTGPIGACSCQSNGVAQCTEGATAIKLVNQRADGIGAMTANVGTMTYEPLHGTVSPAGTVKVADTEGHVAIHHVVSLFGRVRSCSPSGMPGFSAC